MRARIAWVAYGALALALAILGLTHWLWSVTVRGPVLYGEGAVANAAILARDHLQYDALARWQDGTPIFMAANYPPLFFGLASLGVDPFVTGRIASIVATLFVAGAIAWRARPGGWLAAAAIALAWLGSVPVLQWGSALKPDLVALAFTVAAVMALDTPKPRHVLAGALVGLAVMTKPTALLPALAMFVFVARGDPRAAVRALVAGGVAALVVMIATGSGPNSLMLHVIDWNALSWRFDLAASLLLLALAVLAVPIATIALTRPSTTIVTAYAVGALGIVILGGREGATINYLLDLSAALALALGGRAPRLAMNVRFPIAAIVQLAVGVLLLNPFGIIPGRTVTTGAWTDPTQRISVLGRFGVSLLVEDSGLLVANGLQPAVDDVFLWSRLRAREVSGGLAFPAGEQLIAAVRAGRFDAVVTDVDLASLDLIGGFERQRWHPDLVSAVLERYALLPSPDRVPASLFVYTRR
jgi:hypothetical protein